MTATGETSRMFLADDAPTGTLVAEYARSRP
jgi:hypothetical protein